MSPVDYHGWTHAPKEDGGTDPIPFTVTTWPWVALVNSGQTLAGDGSEHESLFTEAYWDSSITPDPTVGGGEFFIQSVDDGLGNSYWSLDLQLEGWYDIEVVHEIEETTSDGGAAVYFSQEVVIVTGAVFAGDTPFGYTAPWTATGPELAIAPYVSTSRRVWINSGGHRVETVVKQNSTQSKGVNGHLKAFYLGGLGGGTQNTDWDVALA